MQVFGIDVIIRITSHFIFIYLTFWALGSIRLETFFKANQVAQIRMVLALVSTAIGYIVSSFFLELIILCKNLFMVGF